MCTRKINFNKKKLYSARGKMDLKSDQMRVKNTDEPDKQRGQWEIAKKNSIK